MKNSRGPAVEKHLSRQWTASHRNGLRQLQHTLDTGVLNSWHTVQSLYLAGFSFVCECCQFACLVGTVCWLYQYSARCYLTCGDVAERQKGDADDNPDVRLYDQQEPSLFVHLCASLPICIATHYCISYVVMFCKKGALSAGRGHCLLSSNIYKSKK
jgi:hypothetical protein